MSTIGYCPIFCTVPQLSAELNNALATLPHDIDGQPQNCLVLCLSPDQRTFTHGITLSTESLNSYFIEWSIRSLSHFSNQTITYIPSTSPDHRINSTTFVVINEKTLQVGTVCVVSEELQIINEEMVCERNWCPWECKDGLEKVRCKIKDLGVLLTCIEEDGIRSVQAGFVYDDVWEF